MGDGLDIIRAYVEGQARLGYTEFHPGAVPSDVILATFPKSGSTWISYLLHQIRSGGDQDFTDIKDEVIDITPGHWDPAENPFEIPQRFAPRTFKTHGRYPLAPKGGKFIYVARNPRDSLWSLYQFIHDLFGIEQRVPLADFFQQYYVERFGSGHDISNVWDHFLSWHPHRNDANVLWLHYEDLLEARPTCLAAIARFMGVDLDGPQLELVLERSAMDAMRRLAGKLNPSQANRVGKITLGFAPSMQRYASRMAFGKLRKGVSGDGQRSLPSDILERLDNEWRERITPVMGYTDYEEMRRACSLLNRVETIVPAPQEEQENLERT